MVERGDIFVINKDTKIPKGFIGTPDDIHISEDTRFEVKSVGVLANGKYPPFVLVTYFEEGKVEDGDSCSVNAEYITIVQTKKQKERQQKINDICKQEISL